MMMMKIRRRVGGVIHEAMFFMSVFIFIWSQPMKMAQLAGAVEYTDCISAEV